MTIFSGNDSRALTSEHDRDLAQSVLKDLEGSPGVLVVEQDGKRSITLPP